MLYCTSKEREAVIFLVYNFIKVSCDLCLDRLRAIGIHVNKIFSILLQRGTSTSAATTTTIQSVKNHTGIYLVEKPLPSPRPALLPLIN